MMDAEIASADNARLERKSRAEARRGASRLRAVVGVLVGALALTASAAAGAAAAADRQRSDVYTFADLPALIDVGESAVVRTERGVTATLATTGLEHGPRTMWWVVWNNPETCGTDGCTEADIGAPGIDLEIGYAAGVVVGESGRGTFTAHLSEGRPLSGFPTEFGITSGSGLIDAQEAEIHLVVRSHGPAIPGLIGEMTRTFHAGCDYSVFGGLIEEGSYGTAGPNACTDVQFAVHP